jgi:large subunit ribosomal protein L15
MNKRKKNTRMRGQTTHGWGAMKKHRGAGNRGGVGNAGSGKRGDCKKPSYWKDNKYFGMVGFTPKGNKPEIVAINVQDLPKYAKKAGKNELNLSDFGINKLLSKGKVLEAYKIIVDYASVKAIEKIESAKGKVTVSKSSSKDEEVKTETKKVKKMSETEDTEN